MAPPFMSLELDGVSRQIHAPVALPRGKSQYPLDKRIFKVMYILVLRYKLQKVIICKSYVPSSLRPNTRGTRPTN
jgi:hypothetical protein